MTLPDCPVASFDPVSWLVLADWYEEADMASLSLLWRLRGEIGSLVLRRCLGMHGYTVCADFLPADRGEFLLRCGWKVLLVPRAKTVHVGAGLHPHNSYRQCTFRFIWHRNPPLPGDVQEYYRRRIFELADAIGKATRK